MSLKLIYIAGAYNGPNIIACLDNMRRGQKLAYDVLKAGYSPFCCFVDYHFSLIGETSIEEYYRYSMNFLKVCDAVLVVPENHETSVGTQNELKVARSLGIPIFMSLDELISYDKLMNKNIKELK